MKLINSNLNTQNNRSRAAANFIKMKLNITSRTMCLQLLYEYTSIKEFLQIFQPVLKMPEKWRGTFLMPALIPGKLHCATHFVTYYERASSNVILYSLYF
jgi:hypothetical protein